MPCKGCGKDCKCAENKCGQNCSCDQQCKCPGKPDTKKKDDCCKK